MNGLAHESVNGLAVVEVSVAEEENGLDGRPGSGHDGSAGCGGEVANTDAAAVGCPV